MSKPNHNSAADSLLSASASELATNRARLQAEAEVSGMGPDEIAGVLNSRPDLPRDLLPEEHATLLALLTHSEFDGRDALLVQLASTRVTGYCGCGCASVDLAGRPDAPAAPRTKSPIPNQARVIDADGEDLGGVIVFLTDGRMSLLEVYAHDQPISPLPSAERLQCHSVGGAAFA